MRAHPSIIDPDKAIARGAVVVDGRVVTNAASLVRAGAAITLRSAQSLRGQAKLEAAFAAFDVVVSGRVALDVGAAAEGFTLVLLQAGARRVYAVDAGHGQLLGSLRQDPRVVNLERVNLTELNVETVPDTIDDRTRREQPQRERPDSSVDLVDGADESGVDRDPEMVADAEEPDGLEGPEQAAVHIVDNEPGVTNHPDDYVG